MENSEGRLCVITLNDSVPEFRLRVILRARELRNVSEACRQFGISRTLFYRWRKRFLQYGVDGLRPRPHRPERWLRQTRPELEQAVVTYALLWPTHGPARIAAQLAERKFGGWMISPSGVYGILRRRGLRTRWERLCRLEDGAAIHTGVLTDRGGQFSDAFHRACEALGIQHRRTKPRHAWTNGFVERQGTILSEL